MPQNHRLLGFLQNLQVNDQNKAQVFAGLEALTSASTFETRGEVFKKAVLDHQAALSGGGTPFQNMTAADPTFLTQAGDNAQGNAHENNCRALQSEAAFKRAFLALNDAPINDLAALAVIGEDDEENLRVAIAQNRNIFGNLGGANLWNGREEDGDDEAVDPLLSLEKLQQIHVEANRLAMLKIKADVAQHVGIIDAKRQDINVSIRGFDQITDLPTLNVRIEELKSSLKQMTKAQADRKALLQAHREGLLNVEANRAWRDDGANQPDAQDDGVTESKRAIVDQLTAKIPALTELIRGIDIDANDSTHLKPLVEKATAEFESIKKAHELLVIARAPDAVDEDLKRIPERALATLQFAYFKKLGEEKKAALDRVIREVAALGDDQEKERLAKLGEAEALLRAIEKAAKDAKALKDAIPGLFDDLGNVERQIVEADVRVVQAKDVLEPFRIMYSPPRASLDYGNFFMERVGVHSEFTDTLVKANAAAAVAGGAPRGPQGAVSIGTLNDEDVYFERVKLEPGDKIKSTITFPSVVTGSTNPQTGQRVMSGPRNAELVQDDKGVVTNMTTVPLKADEKAKLALKQAEMLLTNYTPGSGKIVIRGGSDHAEEAKMVYAILLMLKDNPNRPELQNLEIESYVPGCQGPVVGGLKSKFQSEKAAMASATKAFIHEALHGVDKEGKEIDLIAVKEVEAVRDRIGKFSAVKEARHEVTEELRQRLLGVKSDTAAARTGAAKAMKDQALQDGDKIDLKGHVTRGPRP